jgi:rubrerythrin
LRAFADTIFPLHNLPENAMKQSFTSLNPQEALHVAIFIEERNAELYHRFAEMFVEFRDNESSEIAGIFWEMAAEERDHSSRLQAKYTERFGTSSCSLTEEDLTEFIEMPRLEQADLFATPDEMNKVSARDRALQVALNAERSAQQYYSSLAEKTEPGALRQTYRELADMEDGHAAAIEQKMSAHPARDAGKK